MKKLFIILLLFCNAVSAQLVQPGLLFAVHANPSGKTTDIQVIYRDPGRCTDVSFIELITDSGHVALKPIKYQMSCQIVSWGRITSDYDYEKLKSRPLLAIRIENPASESVYYFQINDKDYLRKILR